MRDIGLEEAIRAAGGITELARRIGISQPSVSNWDRVPAERVLAVESATMVGRAILRPDLYGASPSTTSMRSIWRARRNMRCCLRCWRARRMPLCSRRRRNCAATQRRSALRMSHSPKPRRRPTQQAVEREYFDLFIGLGRGELLPYGSYYLTGFLHERPLARLREDSARSASSAPRATPSRRITRRSCARSCPASRTARFPAPAGTDQQIFEKHMAPWIGRFFADLERAAGRGFLPARRNARPRVHGNRN